MREKALGGELLFSASSENSEKNELFSAMEYTDNYGALLVLGERKNQGGR